MLDAATQHREQHIAKRNYEITVVQEIHICGLDVQRLSLEYVIFFSKYILYLGLNLANTFGDHAIQI